MVCAFLIIFLSGWAFKLTAEFTFVFFFFRVTTDTTQAVMAAMADMGGVEVEGGGGEVEEVTTTSIQILEVVCVQSIGPQPS